jgi:membrane-associated phospholipid phosphatase
LGLLVAVLVSLAIDLPVAAYAKREGQQRWLSEILENAETFGHGVGSMMIVIAVFVLDPARRRFFPQLLAGSLGAGLAANAAKLVLIRVRPRDIEVLPETVWSTFGGLWSISGGNSSQSFPSAHTSTAVGLAVMLSEFYPRGRWFFTAMAVLVGMQRIQCSAHFPSDVFAGAIVGWCVATGCLILDARRLAEMNELRVG